MLVLTRRVGESVIVNDSIKIMLVEIRGDRVRIGVDAPQDVKVDREEIHKQLKGLRKINDSNGKKTA